MVYKVLIVGLGIGSLYHKVLSADKDLFQVITADNNPMKNSDFLDIHNCIQFHPKFDLGIVCTPNHTHQEYINILNTVCTKLLVEKPGLQTENDWYESVLNFKGKLVMVKNNIYRDMLPSIINTVYNNLNDIQTINFNWLNSNRIPNPGSWFTNKKLAFGGVSKDLLPHLLSLSSVILPNLDEYKNIQCTKEQRYTLDTVHDSDYGSVVIENGVYDVDDQAKIKFNYENINVNLNTSWKTRMPNSIINIEIIFKSGQIMTYDLDLCPEKAYRTMIHNILSLNEDEYYFHTKIDLFIHYILEKFN